MTYTILILVNATPAWLTLSRIERDRFVEHELRPILGKYAHSCTIRLFDCDFTNPDVSDFMIVETAEMKDFGFLMGYLRESGTFAVPYFEIKNLIIGVPNNFRGSIGIADVKKLQA
jgi:hypothetical protein